MVDFADIRRDLTPPTKPTSKSWKAELGDEMEHYSRLFKSAERDREEVNTLKDVLFSFRYGNAEIFTDQIKPDPDQKPRWRYRKTLADARSLLTTSSASGGNGTVVFFRRWTNSSTSLYREAEPPARPLN